MAGHTTFDARTVLADDETVSASSRSAAVDDTKRSMSFLGSSVVSKDSVTEYGELLLGLSSMVNEANGE
jgi:hypothetical protein